MAVGRDAEAHCRAYEQVKDHGKAPDATAWQRLVAVAGGKDKVAAYCSEQQARATAAASRPGNSGKPAEGAAGRGGSNGTAGNTGGSGGGSSDGGSSGGGSSGGGSSGNAPGGTDNTAGSGGASKDKGSGSKDNQRPSAGPFAVPELRTPRVPYQVRDLFRVAGRAPERSPRSAGRLRQAPT
ncbi:hypothetical protein [Streptomyces sp. NPDC007905]|uniref:hypothetical protein n=1 Tax=Streptomyces sp. NPDC007905 TaxID=3364788 RepID=UPI0036E422C1